MAFAFPGDCESEEIFLFAVVDGLAIMDQHIRRQEAGSLSMDI